MFRLLILHALGLGANTPQQNREIDKENLLVYSLKGSPRKLVHQYLYKEFGSGDVWVIQEGKAFAVVELTFTGYRITGTHDNNGRFSCVGVENLIQRMNIFCSAGEYDNISQKNKIA